MANDSDLKRANQILFDTYWSVAGWKQSEDQHVSVQDFAHAKAKRVMFDPLQVSHGTVIERLRSVVAKLSLRTVADAFLASLSSRRLDWRSAFGSYAVFHGLESHAAPPGQLQCDCCGLYLNDGIEDLSIMNFERLKWGGVRHLHPTYAMFDLELFIEHQPPVPTSEDIALFRQLVTAMERLPPEVSSAELQGHFGKILKSNKAERDGIVAALGYCGVLVTPGHSNFSDGFVAANRRPLPDRRFVDMPYPACWWNSASGISSERVDVVFGHVL